MLLLLLRGSAAITAGTGPTYFHVAVSDLPDDAAGDWSIAVDDLPADPAIASIAVETL